MQAATSIWQQDACDDPGVRWKRRSREAKLIIFGMLDCETAVIIARINGPAVELGATTRACSDDVSFIAEDGLYIRSL